MFIPLTISLILCSANNLNKLITQCFLLLFLPSLWVLNSLNFLSDSKPMYFSFQISLKLCFYLHVLSMLFSLSFCRIISVISPVFTAIYEDWYYLIVLFFFCWVGLRQVILHRKHHSDCGFRIPCAPTTLIV